MNLILFDGPARNHLLPFTFTRPVSEIRVGILTIAEKWSRRLETPVSYLTQEYLSLKFPAKYTDDNYLIDGSVCPDMRLLSQIVGLKKGQAIVDQVGLVVARVSKEQIPSAMNQEGLELVKYEHAITRINRPWDIFSKNGDQLERDYAFLTEGRKSAKVSSTNTLIGDRVFLEDGAKVEASILNSTSGPIYLAADSEIMEGSIVRGALALGEHSALKMGSKVYGPTTIGPYSKVGGEVSNSVIFGYSNKGHDGFLGNAVLGEWCNIGADSNNSNLKNNYDEVKLWSYVKGGFERTGLQFCGLMMGDHSKCGINTMFNTGTVVGVSANVFGSGFPRNFIPSFAWGGSGGFMEYKIDKALETAQRVMERRQIELDQIERDILAAVYTQTEQYRNFK